MGFTAEQLWAADAALMLSGRRFVLRTEGILLSFQFHGQALVGRPPKVWGLGWWREGTEQILDGRDAYQRLRRVERRIFGEGHPTDNLMMTYYGCCHDAALLTYVYAQKRNLLGDTALVPERFW